MGNDVDSSERVGLATQLKKAGFDDKEFNNSLECLKKTKELFTLIENSIKIKRSEEEGFLPRKFFTGSNKDVNLFICEYFKKILKDSNPVDGNSTVGFLSSHDLKKIASSDEEILEFDYIKTFDMNELWKIARLILLQNSGQHGYLTLGLRTANLFYIKIKDIVIVLVIYFRHSIWHVSCWDLNKYGEYPVSFRVFSNDSK